MSRKDSGMLIVVVALLGLTTANLWERLASFKAPTPHRISELEVGQRLPVLEATILDPSSHATATIELPRGICQLIVAFSPTCPYCRNAAAAEALLPDAPEIPTTWVMLGDDPTVARRFRADLRAGSALAYGARVGAALHVDAIPAGFLVGPDDLIRKIFIYRGDEPRQSLLRQCRNPTDRGGS